MITRLFISILVAFTLFPTSGCWKNDSGVRSGKIVARINDYELTKYDFESEIALTAPNKELPEDPKKAKEVLLEEIITKKILLQEAQRQNFDKERAFMKEIERYWEQALFKLMIRKKIAELSRSVAVEESQMRDEYERMVGESGGNIEPFEKIAADIKNDLYNKKIQGLLDEWLLDLRKKSDVKLYKENL